MCWPRAWAGNGPYVAGLVTLSTLLGDAEPAVGAGVLRPLRVAG